IGKTYPTYKEAIASLDAVMSRENARRVATHAYRDRDGKRVAVVTRYDLPTPEGERQGKTFRPISRHSDGWRISDPPGLWPLYNLHLLDAAGRVFVCEGERCADALAELGLSASTSAHGAKSPGKSDWSALAGREVCILPDADEAGEQYAAE